ncbi:penicillin-binding protein 2 [Halanaerobium salsuginis]|jgi:penicillin-binding protein 2|uniref:Penicillin-binding protein 2 n=1 Tax=Halanaerobium salsuginis TaxID=29563 RepID=A0A1I4HQS4_9FIRM|nr:penicillin-binding protein 2 [Halanaerobium salsuginis]SFL44100.1 penicillin-binding protein 2 [Halanaerobium salsuginis]
MDRHRLLKLLLLFIFTALIARAAYLQILNGDYYYQLSEGNRTSVRPINAPRGKIYDSRGEVIVSNRLTYNLYLMQNEIPPASSVKNILAKLASLSSLSENRLLSNLSSSAQQSVAEPVLLARHLQKKDMVIIAENKDILPGLLVKESSLRDYIYPEYLVHATGYIGEINRNELVSFTKQGYDYSGGDFVGKSGLEKEYEFYLDGKNGAEQIEVNSLGEKIKTIGIKQPISGDSLVLNVNFKLQKSAEEILQKNYQALRKAAAADEDRPMPTGAAAVVLNVKNGAVLAAASLPDYNLNLFAKGISNADYKKLINDPLRPMVNRYIMSAVPPGSIFKLVTGTAAMKELGVKGDTTFYDSNGRFYIPNWSRPFRNWNPYGEGKLDFIKSIARSNNIVFYELGYELYKEFKGEKLAEYAQKYGLGSKAGIDLPGEKSGLVPTDQWKKNNLDQGWYPGDSVNLSIGQGSLLTTPIQIADLIATVANEGKSYQPQLVDKIIDSQGNLVKDIKPLLNIDLSQEIDQNIFKTLKQGMHDVVNKNYGTAYRHFKKFPITVAGKTGTAQTSGSANHGWFGGFAPYQNPEIAVVVLIENSGSSAYSIPIAREIMAYYFGLRNYNNSAAKVYYYSQQEDIYQPE